MPPDCSGKPRSPHWSSASNARSTAICGWTEPRAMRGRGNKCENVNRRMPWGFQNGPSGRALPLPDGLRLHPFRDQAPDVARIRMGFITNRMMKAAATSMAQESQNTVCQPPEYSATTLPSGTRSEATPFAVKIRP